VLRYISEQISLRTGELRVDDLALTTSEGTAAARRTERAARRSLRPPGEDGRHQRRDRES
jgi:hypothetical protein